MEKIKYNGKIEGMYRFSELKGEARERAIREWMEDSEQDDRDVAIDELNITDIGFRKNGSCIDVGI